MVYHIPLWQCDIAIFKILYYHDDICIKQIVNFQYHYDISVTKYKIGSKISLHIPITNYTLAQHWFSPLILILLFVQLTIGTQVHGLGY